MTDNSRRVLRAFVLGGATLTLAGCAMVPPKTFLDPTKVGMFPTDIQESGIRRVLTARESPGGIANATEPTPEDLVPVYEEHRIGRGDQLQIVINDLLSGGAEFRAQLQVDPTGYIRIPELGKINVVGMSEQELEQDLKTRLRESALLANPLVQVVLAFQADRFFSVLGGVRQSGPVALVRPDLRLLDAVALVGDVTPETKKIYVIRRAPEKPTVSPATPESPGPVREPLIIPPPDIDDENAFQTSLYVGAGGGMRQDTQPASPSGEALEEFGDVVAPRSTPPAADEGGPAPETQRAFEPLVYDPTTGLTIEAPASETRPVTSAPATTDLAQPFDWEDVPEYELTQRVIEIDVPALKSGDPRQNIVVRNMDVIVVPIDTGVFYLMGEVNRPGVYGFAGREITIKQAVATAGNLSPLAWPMRCEITRREPGTDKQIIIPVNLDRIFAGLEQDVLLKDSDIVNVGTDIVAPFLFIIRNSFRFTYGFGFVYDRNFADRYSYSNRINPETLDIQRRQSQGLPF